VASGEVLKFDMLLESIDYDSVMSQETIGVGQVKNSIKNGVVAGSGNLTTAVAVDVSLSMESGVLSGTRSHVTVDVSDVQSPQKLMSTIASDGCYNVGHGVVDSLMSLPFFDQLRQSQGPGFPFVTARMTKAPELVKAPVPPRRLQYVLV
jgi:hypothetical protein